MRTFLRYTRLIVMVLVGAFAMVFGEFDDSPGLQGIGLIMIIVAAVLHWRAVRKGR